MKRIIISLSIFTSSLIAICAPHEGALYGYFIINEQGDKVIFSKGNLQYQASTNTWRFAEHQYDFVGDDTHGNVYIGNTKCNNLLVSATYDGWIDLFGFKTNGYNNSYPWQTSTDPSDYPSYKEEKSLYDWGNNPISNGENKPKIWHTLSFQEWMYIAEHRPNARSLHGPAYINGIYGVVLLPDDWEGLPEGLSFKPKEYNEYSLEQWAQMEANGALFLPANNSREGEKMVYDSWQAGTYWSLPTVEYMIIGKLYDGSCFYGNYGMIYRGNGVRLVRPFSLNLEELNTIISEAKTLEITLVNYYKDLYSLFHPAVQEAEQVATNNNATQKQVDAAATELAEQTAKMEAKITARKSLALLEDEVQEAHDYYNSIKDISEYQEVAAVLLDSIGYAEWVIKMCADDSHTKEFIDEARDKLATDLAKAKSDVIAINTAAFAEEKDKQKKAADMLALPDDTPECALLITKAKAAIDALEYNAEKPLAENKAAIQAIVTQLESNLEKQRAAELKKSKDNLTASITEAQTYYEKIKDSTDYTEIAAKLAEAIATAQAVLDNPDASRTKLDKATEALKAAEENAKEEVAKIEVEKARQESIKVLTDSIADATAYYNELLENEEYADIAAELNEAIAAAQAVLDNPDATKEEIDEALEELEEAVSRARTAARSTHGIEEIAIDNNQLSTTKLFHKGNLYILHNGKIYTATGVEIK